MIGHLPGKHESLDRSSANLVCGNFYCLGKQHISALRNIAEGEKWQREKLAENTRKSVSRPVLYKNGGSKKT
jgi:hypothetical protein